MAIVNSGHGEVAVRESGYVRLLPASLVEYDKDDLNALACSMLGESEDTVKNEPDSEENLAVPAGYTYLGQFIDHDLTFDVTSTLGLDDEGVNPVAGNMRTASLDLDCLYGGGPKDQPYMYATEDAAGVFKKASLVLGTENAIKSGRFDLLRVGTQQSARAVIGDPRNDENSIVCNIQLAFIHFHNKVVQELAAGNAALREEALFFAARKRVRWVYQKIVAEDFLPRIIQEDVYKNFRKELNTKDEGAFRLYTAEKRGALPLEFAGAAYRFGHSMVRTGYKLNRDHVPQKIFVPDADPGDTSRSLMGFGKLPDHHWIEWSRFLQKKDEAVLQNTVPPGQEKHLQWAYRIDTSLVDPLSQLPAEIGQNRSLALLNLLRGNLFRLPSGQVVAEALGVKKLDEKYLVVRDSAAAPFGFRPLSSQALIDDTPLWFYVLAEAQQELVDTWLHKRLLPHQIDAQLEEDDLLLGIEISDARFKAPRAQLGAVGGGVLLETFFGLLLADKRSYLNAKDAEAAEAAAWLAKFSNENGRVTMWKMLEYAGLV